MGYAALIFWLMANYYKVDSWEGRFIVLEMWYSHLRAKLPEQYENREAEYKEKIDSKLTTAADEIEKARELYHSSFEGLDCCNPEEKVYAKCLSGIYIRLDEITAISKMVDSQRMGPTQAPGADE